MKLLLRQFLFFIALSVAASPALAKESTKVPKKSKVKSGLFKKTKKSRSLPRANTSSTIGKAQYRNTTVNINKASASALSAMLVGIGPVRAKAIEKYRRKNGKFSSLKDLMNVEGIGEATFKKLKRNISLNRGETAAPKGYKMGSSSNNTRNTISRTPSRSTTGKKKLKIKTLKKKKGS